MIAKEATRVIPNPLRHHLGIGEKCRTTDQMAAAATLWQIYHGTGVKAKRAEIYQLAEYLPGDNEETALEERKADAYAIAYERKNGQWPKSPWHGRDDCCIKCGDTDHWGEDCRKARPVCHNCRQGGHPMRLCQWERNPVPPPVAGRSYPGKATGFAPKIPQGRVAGAPLRVKRTPLTWKTQQAPAQAVQEADSVKEEMKMLMTAAYEVMQEQRMRRYEAANEGQAAAAATYAANNAEVANGDPASYAAYVGGSGRRVTEEDEAAPTAEEVEAAMEEAAANATFPSGRWQAGNQ
jgi:hypothetical protein